MLILSVFIDPETFLRVCLKLYVGFIQIRHKYFFTQRFVRFHGEGFGWVFRLFLINLFLFIYNILQVLCSRFILLIFDLCLFHLMYNSSLILKLFLGCVENCLWGLYKSDIRIFFPQRFVRVYGEGVGSLVSLEVINLLTVFK